MYTARSWISERGYWEQPTVEAEAPLTLLRETRSLLIHTTSSTRLPLVFTAYTRPVTFGGFTRITYTLDV